MRNFLITIAILLTPILFGSSSSDNLITRIDNNSIEISYDNPEVWVTGWIPSDSYGPAFNKGRFYYRVSRSSNEIYLGKNEYAYCYSIYFLSESYYSSYTYSSNNVYIAPTKIDLMSVIVDGEIITNKITHTPQFWIVFKGDFVNGMGDLRVIFYHHSPSPNIDLSHTNPYPF